MTMLALLGGLPPEARASGLPPASARAASTTDRTVPPRAAAARSARAGRGVQGQAVQGGVEVGGLERAPAGIGAEVRSQPLDHVGDVRLGAEELGAQAPDPRIGRIGELEAAVAAEHRHPFVKVVESIALDVDQGVVGALEGESVGHVLEGQEQAAHGMGRDDHAQGAPVR